MTDERTRRTVLAASGSLAALGLAGCVGGDDEEHVAVESFEFVDPETGDSLAAVDGSGWKGGPVLVPLEGRLSVGARAEDADGELEFGADDPYRVGARVVEDGDETVAIEPHEDRVDLIGHTAGETEIVAELWDGDRFGWDSPKLVVEVVDDFEEAANHAGDESSR